MSDERKNVESIRREVEEMACKLAETDRRIQELLMALDNEIKKTK